MDRYIRQTRLEEIGPEGCARLASARVTMVGCGALGTAAGLYLAGAGTGHITIADFDTVDITNLQRQPAFTESDLGAPKSATLGRRLRELNSGIEVESVEALLRHSGLERLAAGADVVVEATDNPASKRMVAEVCESLSVPYVTAGVSRWQGQVMSWEPGYPGWNDLFPENDEAGFTPCSLGGIIGPLPGIAGCIEATEAIKIITGAGTPLFGRLLTIDALTMTFSTISLL